MSSEYLLGDLFMKRFTTLLMIITIFTIVIALTGCSSGSDFARQSNTFGENEIKSIIIDVIDREIAVTVSDDNQVHIDYYENDKEYYNIAVMENKVLKVEFAKNKEWLDYIGTKTSAEYRIINVKIPYEVLTDLTIITTNEDIKLSPIVVANGITLSSNGGNIEFEQISVGNALTLTAKNGEIKGTVIGSYDVFSIECEIKKGDCNLPISKKDGEKLLKATCNNGNIKIDFV